MQMYLLYICLTYIFSKTHSIYIYVVCKNNVNRSNEMERDKGGINGRAWNEKRQRENDRIILCYQRVKEMIFKI